MSPDSSPLSPAASAMAVANSSVVGKPPVYFPEYRKAMVLAAMVNLMEERPGIATTLYKQYLDVAL